MLTIARPAVWDLPWTAWTPWLALHAGPLIELLSFVAAAIALLLLRPRDRSALIIVATLAVTGLSTVGSLLGSEAVLPPLLGAPLTVFAWLAMPLAFPLIATSVA